MDIRFAEPLVDFELQQRLRAAEHRRRLRQLPRSAPPRPAIRRSLGVRLVTLGAWLIAFGSSPSSP